MIFDKVRNERENQRIREALKISREEEIKERDIQEAGTDGWIKKAKRIVSENYVDTDEETGLQTSLEPDDFHIVSLSHNIQHWRVVMIAYNHTGLYFEVHYNGDIKTTTLDLYAHVDTVVIPDNKEHNIA